MVTAAKSGRISTLALSTNTSTPSYSAVGENLDMSLAITRATTDVTNKDSGVFNEFIAQHGNMVLSGNGNYIDGDAGQVILLDTVETGANIAVRARGEVTSAKDEWLDLIGMVTAADLSFPVGGQTQFSFSIQITGSFARSNQP